MIAYLDELSNFYFGKKFIDCSDCETDYLVSSLELFILNFVKELGEKIE